VKAPIGLIGSTFKRYKQLILLNGEVEDYILYAIAKIFSFAAGIIVGYIMWA